jgi:hypothetical protein
MHPPRAAIFLSVVALAAGKPSSLLQEAILHLSPLRIVFPGLSPRDSGNQPQLKPEQQRVVGKCSAVCQVSPLLIRKAMLDACFPAGT